MAFELASALSGGAGPAPTGTLSGVLGIRRRSVVFSTALLAGAGALGGCTVPADGFTGVSVTPDGAIAAVIQTCRHSMDGATLYWGDDPKGSDSEHALMGRWELSRPTTGKLLSWPISSAAAADGAQSTTAVKTLAEGRTYSLYGWTNDSSWSTTAVSFTLADLRALPAGHVLVRDPGGQPREVTMGEFSRLACADRP